MMSSRHALTVSPFVISFGVFACSAEGDSTTENNPAQVGTAGDLVGMGGSVTTNPPVQSAGGTTSSPVDPCAAQPTCYEKCTCGGLDHDTCVSQCTTGSMWGGSGGASPAGAGGTPAVSGAGGAPPVVSAGGATTGIGGMPPGVGGAPDVAGAGGAAPTSDFPVAKFQTTPFRLEPGQELYRCQNFANPFPGGDVAIIQSQSFMSKGSHHMFVMYNNQNRDGGIEPCSGLEFSQTIISTGNHETNVVYPPGVGRFMAANQGVRVLMHTINTTSEPIDFKVDVVFHYTDPNSLEMLAGSVFLNQLLFAIPPGVSNYAVNGGGTIPEDVYLLTGQSHMHQQGVRFEAKYTGSGETIYQSTEWSEPPTKVYDPPMLLKAGTRIEYTCYYDNNTNLTLTFGESAATNEMCIFSGTYYAPRNGQLQGKTLGGAVTF